jgi:hypothetical protein
MLQHLIVGLIVASAALYSLWSLMPAGLRRSAAARLAQGLRRAGMADDRRAAELESALAAGSGCSECSSCKGCATPAKPGADGTAVVAMPVSRRRR